MAVIFNQRVRGPTEGGGRSPHLIEWHSSEPLLAVASRDEAKDADGTVHIHTEQVNYAHNEALAPPSAPDGPRV